LDERAAAEPHNGVAVLHWPHDATWRDILAEEGRARLLLVERGVVPPPSLDVLEDWMWVPADPVELDARTATLATRWQSAAAVRPSIDDDGVLHAGERSVALSPQRVALARLLVDRFDEVVRHEELMSAGFSGPVREGAVYLAIHRLRQRVAGVGLTIAPVRGHGFVLAWAQGTRPPSS
jgi:hypothetical protein